MIICVKNTLLGDYYCASLVEDFRYNLDDVGMYKVYEFERQQEYIEYIRKQPESRSPLMVGLHENADITRQLAETKELLGLLGDCNKEQLENKDAGDSAGEESSLFEKMLEQMYNDFPNEFDVPQALKQYPVDYNESMNTVLTQELTRFNVLIRMIRESLHLVI